MRSSNTQISKARKNKRINNFYASNSEGQHREENTNLSAQRFCSSGGTSRLSADSGSNHDLRSFPCVHWTTEWNIPTDKKTKNSYIAKYPLNKCNDL